jgi:hypothetical protein
VRELVPPAPEPVADADSDGPAYMTDDIDPLDELD